MTTKHIQAYWKIHPSGVKLVSVNSIHIRALMNNVTVNTSECIIIKNTLSHTIHKDPDMFRPHSDHPQEDLHKKLTYNTDE